MRAGIAPTIIASIAAPERPDLPDDRARAVYDYTVALNERHLVPDAVHAAASAALEEAGLVELVGVIGYYTLVAMTLNAFEIGLPPGEEPGLRTRPWSRRRHRLDARSARRDSLKKLVTAATSLESEE